MTMENEKYNIHDVAGASGHYGLDLSEFKHLHTYVERPETFDEKLYHDKRILNHAHYYELDEFDEETFEEKLYHLRNLILHEIDDFCKRNNVDKNNLNFNLILNKQ